MIRTIPLPQPFLPRATLGPLMRGRGDPTMKMDARSCVRATRTPEGPATVSMVFEPGGATCEAWGDGSQWLLQNVPSLLGINDQPGLFAPTDQPLRDLNLRFAGLRLGASMGVVEVMIPTIIEQKVTGKQARRSYARLAQTYGEKAPGPFDLTLPPHPDVLAGLAYYDFHRLGVEKRRADVVRAVAADHTRLDALVTQEPKVVSRRLQAISGVGPWTSAETIRLALGDPDAVSIGDFHLPSIVAWALAGEARADDRRMLELLAPYEGQRARVARLIELSGIKPPAFSHRRPVNAIEKI